LEWEAEVLAPFLDRASRGGILGVPKIKAELEVTLGRTVALSSVYNVLHRHGWRKVAPDKRHPQSDPAAQEVFKKTPRNPPIHPNRPGARCADPSNGPSSLLKFAGI
jgi:Winged helix-turn helix